MFSEFFTKFISLYAAKDYTAESLADAIITDVAVNGLFDNLFSDPGSDLTSKAIKLVSQWMGYTHKFSLVDRHESNGVERASAEVLTKLRALCADYRMEKQWSRPRILKLAEWFLNSQVHSETGISPFEAKFGTFDAKYHQLPKSLPMSELAPKLLKSLNDQLEVIREKMVTTQEKKIKKRAERHLNALQNLYQPGDRVQWDAQERVPKLSGQYLGPYEVLGQTTNTVTCRHLCSGAVKPLHAERLKIFHGTLEEAKALARLDNNQHLVMGITGFVGDPLKRSTCEFEVTFMDGDVHWASWEPDITSTQAFETFANSKPHLRILLLDLEVAKQRVSHYKRSPIQEVNPPMDAFLDLSVWPHWFYHFDEFLDVFHTSYFTPIVYLEWQGSGQRKVLCSLPEFGKRVVLDGYQVHAYGTYKECPADAVLVDKAFLVKFPRLAQGEPWST
jgi:hypothetical protein